MNKAIIDYISDSKPTKNIATMVTVRSSGPVAEMYPDSLGQYNIIKDVFRNDHPVYKHVDRDDRFIIHTGRNLNIKVILMILFLIKVNSGTSQRICLPRRDFSRVTGKVWYQRRDGITILINMTLTIVGQKGFIYFASEKASFFRLQNNSSNFLLLVKKTHIFQ